MRMTKGPKKCFQSYGLRIGYINGTKEQISIILVFLYHFLSRFEAVCFCFCIKLKYQKQIKENYRMLSFSDPCDVSDDVISGHTRISAPGMLSVFPCIRLLLNRCLRLKPEKSLATVLYLIWESPYPEWWSLYWDGTQVIGVQQWKSPTIVPAPCWGCNFTIPACKLTNFFYCTCRWCVRCGITYAFSCPYHILFVMPNKQNQYRYFNPAPAIHMAVQVNSITIANGSWLSPTSHSSVSGSKCILLRLVSIIYRKKAIFEKYSLHHTIDYIMKLSSDFEFGIVRIFIVLDSTFKGYT